MPSESCLLAINSPVLTVITCIVGLLLITSLLLTFILADVTLQPLYFKFLIKKIPQIIIPIIFGILIALPVLFSFLNNGGTARLGGVGLSADMGPINRANELINHHNNTKIINRLMHNKRVLYLVSWAQKYSSHFDLNFLAINGDEVPRSKSPEVGQIHLIEIFFVFLGLIYLFKSTTGPATAGVFNRRPKIFIILFLLISPIASSLTFQAPSALRSLPMVIPLSILISCGIYWFFSLIHKSRIINLVSILFLVLYFYFVAYYLDSYFFHYAKRYPFAWQYKFDELVPFVESQKYHYKNIYITNKYDQPYILFLFYSHYNPRLIQSQIKLTPPDKFGFSTVESYDNYHFGKIEWDNIPVNSLVIASDEDIPINPIKIINFSNNKPAFKIYEK